ncbi:hypothetical protein [Sagittula sp. MA-2]|jgi:hypothetical protein|uniref:hypothetical protein n=1 Tax=Sagittula sp. MA-2 TaxID=3048007 RepID=UPI0024C4092A|nr:hypothetical protein [Sagittula sp. MA-2]WHZ36508.1 hypothetical protein QNI11_05720 [Sagittula sp. MA-2]
MNTSSGLGGALAFFAFLTIMSAHDPEPAAAQVNSGSTNDPITEALSPEANRDRRREQLMAFADRVSDGEPRHDTACDIWGSSRWGDC